MISTINTQAATVTIIGGRDLAGDPIGFSIDPRGVITETYTSPSAWPQRPEGHGVLYSWLAEDLPTTKTQGGWLKDLRGLPPGSIIDVQNHIVVPAAIDAISTAEILVSPTKRTGIRSLGAPPKGELWESVTCPIQFHSRFFVKTS